MEPAIELFLIYETPQIEDSLTLLAFLFPDVHLLLLEAIFGSATVRSMELMRFEKLSDNYFGRGLISSN